MFSRFHSRAVGENPAVCEQHTTFSETSYNTERDTAILHAKDSTLPVIGFIVLKNALKLQQNVLLRQRVLKAGSVELLCSP